MKRDQPLFFDVIRDKNFRGLMRESQRRALTWQELLEHPLPASLSPEQTRGMLESIGRCQGVHLFEGFEGDLLWYRRTYEVEALALRVEELSSPRSPLAAFAARCDESDAGDALRLEEGKACLALSHIPAPEGEWAEVRARPDDPAARVLTEFVALDRALASPVAEDARLEAEEVLRFAERLRGAWRGEPCDQLDASAARLDQVIAYANDVDNHDDVDVLKGSLIGAYLRRQNSFGRLTPLVASLATRRWHRMHGHDVLAIVPASRPVARWRAGELGGLCLCDWEEYRRTLRHTPSDLTLHQTLQAQCLVFALAECEARVGALGDVWRALRHALESDTHLNERQRSALVWLAQHPEGHLSIRDYSGSQLASYATARRDLLALEERGLAESVVQGKALVFRASEALLALAR